MRKMRKERVEGGRKEITTSEERVREWEKVG